jgi:hypothetical protein
MGFEILDDHVDVRDPILFVWIGHGPESKAEVEILQPTLSRDLNGLTWRQQFEASQGFSHQSLPNSGSPHLTRGDDTADRRLIVSHTGLEDAGVRDERSFPRPLQPPEEMPRIWVASIGVGIRAVLLHDENRFAKSNDRV